jgi:hypothetical protein
MSIYRKYIPSAPSNRRSQPATDDSILAIGLR